MITKGLHIMNLKEHQSLDLENQHPNRNKRNGLKGIVNRGMFNPHYNNVEFYKKQPGTRADVAMACFRRSR